MIQNEALSIIHDSFDLCPGDLVCLEQNCCRFSQLTCSECSSTLHPAHLGKLVTIQVLKQKYLDFIGQH